MVLRKRDRWDTLGRIPQTRAHSGKTVFAHILPIWYGKRNRWKREQIMDRQEVFGLVRKKYGTEPDYPWGDWNAVLRHKDTGKWYGVILEVKGSRLGLGDDRIVDVLNVKADPVLIGSLLPLPGYFPAYHMNKENWISILLGESDLDKNIRNLLQMSYELIEEKK